MKTMEGEKTGGKGPSIWGGEKPPTNRDFDEILNTVVFLPAPWPISAKFSVVYSLSPTFAAFALIIT